MHKSRPFDQNPSDFAHYKQIEMASPGIFAQSIQQKLIITKQCLPPLNDYFCVIGKNTNTEESALNAKVCHIT
jgi:hypothetical protein